MTEANPGDGELHLESSDPFQSPTERMGSEASMRRLFLVQLSRVNHICRFGVNQFCRFTSSSRPRCRAASVR